MKLMEIYFKECEDHQKIYGKDKAILLMQVGSFFEAYQTDTQGFNLKIISELTNFVITKKDKSNPVTNIDNPYTMGFPLNSLNKYVKILTDAGYQVKVIEQTTPNKTKLKIERQTKAVYSSGTMIDLDIKDNNYILSIFIEDSNIGVTIADISTGEWEIKDCICDLDDQYQALDEVSRYINTYNPVEIVISGNLTEKTSKYLELDSRNYYIFDSKDKLFHKLVYQNSKLSKIFNQKDCIEYLNIEEYHYGRISLMLLLEYIEMHNPELLKNLTNIQNYINNKYLYLGNNALNQLHVLSNEGYQNKIGNKYKSLYDVVNFTLTNMGRRRLKRELSHPLVSKTEIEERYNLIVKFKDLAEQIKEDMYYINDIEKMHKKLMVGELHPFELYKWIVSYERIISLNKKLNKIYPLSSNITEIYNLLNSTFDLDKLPAYTISQIKENIFRPKINDELDKIQGKIDGNRILLKKVANYVENFDLKQDKKTIGCKVEFNERDGYHLITTKKRWLSIEKEIKKGKLEGIKLEELIGKDNSVSGTKIFSEQLKKISDELIRSETEICNKMQEAYVEFSINFCEKYKLDINNIINWVSYVDFIYSGAQCIHKYRYTIPIIKEDSKSWFSCKQIRHPIVERISDIYIPFNIDLGKEYVGITLFGLNSAGKSTLQKSVGLNIILAQIGYPVACVELEYSPYHSLFTRISGNDNLFKGLSSFTVEMLEIRNILKRTDEHSLIIADEVCRGTEYESGLIIVLTMIKLLAEKKANFITASHLHEIVKSDIYTKLSNVKSFHIKISYDEKTNIIKYDRELCEGSGDNFYGLLVAKSLIDDKDFIQISMDIKKSITETKIDTSVYNSKIIKQECEVCHKKVKDNEVSLETHHIVFQKDADKDGLINKYQHKNHESNLIVICQKCHDDVDRGNINIIKKIETSKGNELVIEDKVELIEKEEDNSINKLIKELHSKKLSQKLIKERLSKQNINISLSKISKVINS